MSRRWIPRRWNLRFVRAYFSQAKSLMLMALAAATIFKCAGRPAFWPAHPPPKQNKPHVKRGAKYSCLAVAGTATVFGGFAAGSRCVLACKTSIWPVNPSTRLRTGSSAGYLFMGYAAAGHIFFRIVMILSFPRKACPERKPNGRESRTTKKYVFLLESIPHSDARQELRTVIWPLLRLLIIWATVIMGKTIL